MKPILILFGIATVASVLTGCAHDRPQHANCSKSFPRLRDTRGILVVTSSIEVGSVVTVGGTASVKLTRYQAKQTKSSEWAIVLGVGQLVYFRPDEIPPVEKAIASILELPAESKGFDEINARYTTPSGNLTVSRFRQPGATVNGVMQYVGMRYQINDWYTMDPRDLRRVKELLKEARSRLETLRYGSAEPGASPNGDPSMRSGNSGASGGPPSVS